MDGEYLIAGGKSKYVCIYNVKEEMLVKRFEISQNKSFDGINVMGLKSKPFFRLLFCLIVFFFIKQNKTK